MPPSKPQSSAQQETSHRLRGAAFRMLRNAKTAGTLASRLAVGRLDLCILASLALDGVRTYRGRRRHPMSPVLS
jgi:hypothetical protein